MKIGTQAIHAGFIDDPTTRAVAVPIYQTTSYSFRDTQHGANLFDLKEPGSSSTTYKHCRVLLQAGSETGRPC